MEEKQPKTPKRIKFGLTIQPELYQYMREQAYARKMSKSSFLEFVLEADRNRRTRPDAK